jgi:hypothetical protein
MIRITKCMWLISSLKSEYPHSLYVQVPPL